MVRAALPAALGALLASGCTYKPDLGGACAVRCAEGSCPGGTSCRDDGYCHAGGSSDDFEACSSDDDAGSSIPDAAVLTTPTRFHVVDPPRSILADTLENHAFGSLIAAEPGVIAVLVRQDISLTPDGDVIWAIWPGGGTPSPQTPTMNVATGTHRMALAISGVSADGEIHYLVDGGATTVSGEYKIDVIGEFREDGELTWQNAEPSRIFGPTSVNIAPTDVVVPGDLEHAFVALHVQEPAFAGSVTASVSGAPDAQLRFEPDESLSASDLLPVGEEGMFQLSASADGASVMADLLGGLVTAGEESPSFHLLAPSTRIFDSRMPWGDVDVPHKVPTGKTVLDLAAYGVPATADAVMIHVAAFDAFDETAITLFGDPDQEPAITTLQQEQGTPGWRITSALDIVPLAGDQLTIRNTAAPAHLVIDVFGYVE